MLMTKRLIANDYRWVSRWKSKNAKKKRHLTNLSDSLFCHKHELY